MNIFKKLQKKKNDNKVENKFSYIINDKNVFFCCDSKLQKAADFFADILKKEDATFNILQNDKVIQIGFNYFKVVQHDNEFQIVTYDLLNNPFENTQNDLSLALTIFHKQSEILEQTKSIPTETSFQDTMIAHKAALRSNHIYLQRSEPEGNNSGWYLGPVEGDTSDNPEDYVRLYTYQLLSVCSSALDILLLPAGTLAIYKNGELMEAVNEQDEKIL